MLVCGSVLLEEKDKSFWLKCAFCDCNTTYYNDFITHVRNIHKTIDESWMDAKKIEQLEEDLEEKIKDGINIGTFNYEEIEKDEGTFVGNMTVDPILTETDESSNSDPERDATKVQETQSVNYFPNEEEGQYEEDKLEEGSENSKKVQHVGKFNPTFYRRKSMTMEFIKLYKAQTCLWDPRDPKYNDCVARSQAKLAVLKALKEFNIHLNERTLNVAISKLRTQFINIKRIMGNSKRKLSAVALEHFEKCSFLDVSIDTKEDININSNSDSEKSLEFEKWNINTLTFIDAYSSFPVLYDIQHANYANIPERRKAYEELTQILQTKSNAEFHGDKLYKMINQLHDWYHKNRGLEKITKDGKQTQVVQKYLKRCQFLLDQPQKKRLTCEICQKTLHNEATLQGHMYKEHQIGKLPHKCGQCERAFDQKSSLQVHIQRVHVGKIHQCEFCDRRFAVLADLQLHRRTHTGERPYVCEQCGKAFRIRTQLGYHVTAIHTKIRAFKCTMCPKDFLKRRDLTDHIKAHLNVRDKICETCGKGFTNCHSLIRHRQIHSEVKKFECKLCDAKFHQFVGLNAHMKRTHNIVKKITP